MEIANVIKQKLKRFVPTVVINRINKQSEQQQLTDWKKAGCPVPPPHIVKQLTVSDYQKKSGYTTLVETGTYLGDLVEAQKKNFSRIISIELGVDLFKMAQKRFKKDRNVFLVQGDSGKVLPSVLKEINEPGIFWLDGHYSEGFTARGDKECPIFEELNAVLSAKKFDHILLIDDARRFIGEGDYPTIEQLTEYVKSKDKNYKVEVKDDIIRFVIQEI